MDVCTYEIEAVISIKYYCFYGSQFVIKNFVYVLGKIDLRKFIFAFPFIALLHELEEWNILKWHLKYNTNVPFDVADFHLRLAFILISLLIFIWTFISLISKNNKITAIIIFPLIAMSLLNGIEHLIWFIEFGVYAPGVVFGFFFEAPLLLYIVYRMLKEKIIPKWYVILLGILVTFGIIMLILLGNKLDPMIAGAMKLSKELSDLIWGWGR